IRESPRAPRARETGRDREEGAEWRPRSCVEAAAREAVGEEPGEPAPHRVQLPHVSEIAEALQPWAGRAEHARDLARIEARARKRERSFANREQRDDRGQRRRRGAAEHG